MLSFSMLLDYSHISLACKVVFENCAVIVGRIFSSISCLSKTISVLVN